MDVLQFDSSTASTHQGHFPTEYVASLFSFPALELTRSTCLRIWTISCCSDCITEQEVRQTNARYRCPCRLCDRVYASRKLVTVAVSPPLPVVCLGLWQTRRYGERVAAGRVRGHNPARVDPVPFTPALSPATKSRVNSQRIAGERGMQNPPTFRTHTRDAPDDGSRR